MTPGVPPRLPLLSQRLVVVTGKGGVGKTTVTAALAYAAAASERRVLAVEIGRGSLGSLLGGIHLGTEPMRVRAGLAAASLEDRKSTRLNSSHSQISYAVFCLKKK